MRRLLTDPSTLGCVLERLSGNRYLTVAIIQGDEVPAVLVRKELLDFLVDMYGHLIEAQATPEWGALRAENRKLRRISAGLARELARSGGSERISPELWTEIRSSIFEALEKRQTLWTEERDPINVHAITGDEGESAGSPGTVVVQSP